MFESMFTQANILQTGLNAANVRHEVLVNNLANGDVPNYKRKDVEFQSVLNNVINEYKFTGDLNLVNAEPQIYTDNEDFSYRLDGNNVDVDYEMSELYKNSLRYEVLANSVTNHFKRINLALSQ